MKLRSLLTVVAMLSVLLFGMGTAYAVTGVADDVPGTDIVFPIICEGFQPNSPSGDPIGAPNFGTLNTVWAIAETSGASCVADASVCTPTVPSASGVGVRRANVNVYDRFSTSRLDASACWSKHDVISSHCQGMISLMNAADRDAMEVTIAGKTYFAGYITYQGGSACNPSYPACIGTGCSATGASFITNQLAAWVYLNDIANGFAAGFNGISIEGGIGPELEELCEAGASCAGNFIGVTAQTVYPRYFLLNSDPETFNWWIFLLGRNEYFLDSTAPANTIHRQLSCFVCDEGEVCISNNIPIPHELNIINVAGIIPGGVYPPPVFPKAGFAYCTVDESGFLTGSLVSTVISGTLSFDGFDGTPNADAETYSLFGWAYQRAIPVSVGDARLSVVHPIHRLYCNGSGAPIAGPYVAGTTLTAAELPSRFDAGTVANCSIAGTLLSPIAP